MADHDAQVGQGGGLVGLIPREAGSAADLILALFCSRDSNQAPQVHGLRGPRGLECVASHGCPARGASLTNAQADWQAIIKAGLPQAGAGSMLRQAVLQIKHKTTHEPMCDSWSKQDGHQWLQDAAAWIGDSR